MDDNDIIELFWQRNQDAIVQTDLTYGPMCRALSRRILHNSEDAEECVNDSYYRLWERIPPEREIRRRLRQRPQRPRIRRPVRRRP